MAEGSSYTYTCNGNGQPAKYVRMRLTQDSPQWLQLFEFEVNKGEELGGAIPVASPTTPGCRRCMRPHGFHPLYRYRCGYVEYQLGSMGRRSMRITVLFQGRNPKREKPAAEIQTDGEWVNVL